MSKRIAVIIVAVATCLACSEGNNERPANQITTFDPDQDNSNNVNADSGDNASTGDMGGADVAASDTGEGMDFAVAAEGFMHGTWIASRVDGSDIATLQLRHEVGETTVSGTFQMTEPAAFGQLGGTNWLNNTFTTSWTVVIDGLDERFSLTMCTTDGSDDELACRFADPLSGDVVDATMTRQ